MNNMKNLNKDFYDRLPSMVCEILEGFIPKYGAEDWFEKAWHEYRQYILGTENMDDMRMPGYIFKKYVASPSNN